MKLLKNIKLIDDLLTIYFLFQLMQYPFIYISQEVQVRIKDSNIFFWPRKEKQRDLGLKRQQIRDLFTVNDTFFSLLG